jgi:nucleotide-binding universal stress UspA family protein
MYENHRIAAPEADRCGHVKEPTPNPKIAYSNVSEPIPAHQRAAGSDFNPAIRIRRILAPTDLSDDSREAVKYAIHLAELVGAQLTLLHFDDESRRQVNPTGARGYESMLEEERTLKNKLYALREEIRKIYRNCDSYFYIGSPSKEIPKVAKELNADLVVISTHNPQGSSCWIFGSDAERILRHSPCPVLIVRQEPATEHQESPCFQQASRCV